VASARLITPADIPYDFCLKEKKTFTAKTYTKDMTKCLQSRRV